MDKLLKEWKHRLNIDDWTILVKWDCPLTDFELKDVCGESIYEETNKSAIIRIMSEKDYGERMIPYDSERILVHELLHCKLCYIQETENETQNRLVHGYIEDLARALIDAKRYKDKTRGGIE